MEPAEPTSGPPWHTRLFWLGVLLVCALLAIGVFVAMPQGFPVGHRHQIANTILPVAVIGYAVVTASILFRRAWRVTTMLLLIPPIALIGAAFGGVIIFPISGRLPAAGALGASLLIILALRRSFKTSWPTGKSLLRYAPVALLVGAMLPLTQRSDLADTRPLRPVSDVPNVQPSDVSRATQRISPTLRVVPSTGEVMADVGTYSFHVLPLLSFDSRSPDRCWTSLAPKASRVGPRRQLLGAGQGAFTYTDDGYSTLAVRQDSDDHVQIDATAMLSKPVYSHLNTFAETTVIGHRKLSLVFSPAPDVPIDVRFSEYPVGLPARSAFVDENGVFHVVEATSGEKGPFKELARGPLARGEPLTIMLLDEGVHYASLTLLDFSSQASTQLSPTAGWGLPVNAIEFFLYDRSDKSPAGIFVTLAATSVGRGWDSVGHTAGTYRNRMTLSPVARSK